ncbi:unnamed protein product [Brassicogethes aeneus]|uniref:Uncharacterized protein n=1 Tax=Brassicogethes aeneus TaxID=1431903 RepID=A0A9P0BF08_BRAAE|nr:unnamed protein product [Brassicogethes aeneus]
MSKTTFRYSSRQKVPLRTLNRQAAKRSRSAAADDNTIVLKQESSAFIFENRINYEEVSKSSTDTDTSDDNNDEESSKSRNDTDTSDDDNDERRSGDSCNEQIIDDCHSNLIFYSIPVLNSYLEEKYFQHLMLLVIGLFDLLQDKILIQPDLQCAEKLLDLFVEQAPKLYGDRVMTYNFHLVRHLVLFVRRCVRSISAFPWENQNGYIAFMETKIWAKKS